MGVWIAEEAQDKNKLSDLIKCQTQKRQKGKALEEHTVITEHTGWAGVRCREHTYTLSC